MQAVEVDGGREGVLESRLREVDFWAEAKAAEKKRGQLLTPGLRLPRLAMGITATLGVLDLIGLLILGR
jgi:hypothetical protein